MNPKISVLIPIYNGAQYLDETLNSILNQKCRDYEVLCIDDCSADESEAIVKKFELLDSRVRLIKITKNLGIVPKVLNYATSYIRGEYFVYASQDDFFSDDWLSCMLSRAEETGADATIPTVVFYHRTCPQKNYTQTGLFGDKNVILNNREALIYSLDWTIVGNALWRTRLIKEVGYYDFGMNADEYTARVFFFNCNKVVFSGGVFYYRQDNPEAITKKVTIKTFDTPLQDIRLCAFLEENKFQEKFKSAIIKQFTYRMIHLKVECVLSTLHIPVSIFPQRDSFDFKLANKKLRNCYNQALLLKRSNESPVNFLVSIFYSGYCCYVALTYIWILRIFISKFLRSLKRAR